MRFIFVSHWPNIPNMIFLNQIVAKILSKIAGPCNIGQWHTYILRGQSLCHTDLLSQIWYIFYEVNLCVLLTHYTKYDIPPWNSLHDTKQNHWTTKCRSIYFMRSIHYPKYDIHPSNSLQDIRQNHSTMIYRSHWPSPHVTKAKVIWMTDLL